MKTKKGFYFTLIVLFCIILLLLISFQTRREYYSEGIRTRILTTNNFIKSMELDASRAVYISSYRTLVALTDYVASSRSYIRGINSHGNNITIDSVFADALFNGSLTYSMDFPGSEGILANASLKDWQEKSVNLAKATNLDLSFEDINSSQLLVTQTDPWSIVISIPVNYNLSDPVSGVKWMRNTRINTSVPILNNFEDPLYVIEFGPACGNKILKNPYQALVNYTGSLPCNATNLTQFFNIDGKGSMYVASTTSPSYLNRLRGNLTCLRTGDRSGCHDPYGIESLINPSKWGDCGLVNGSSTIVDFRYNYIPADYHVSGADSGIFISMNDFSVYEIDNACAV